METCRTLNWPANFFLALQLPLIFLALRCLSAIPGRGWEWGRRHTRGPAGAVRGRMD